ncbi:transketolase-like TK C-terminal-containing protein [Kitasatospora kazusensis]|uniref:transketolase-like TK C-terminal-containing protein n=1 Tax=Kitasatospora kazusensis TaxID=407974 RepID=UPI0031E19B02
MSLGQGADVADIAARGGYVLVEAGVGKGEGGRSGGGPAVILIATPGELAVALRAREILECEGTPTRVVSMPCAKWFEEQDAQYRESVLPAAVRVRVSVKSASALGWYVMLGAAGESPGLDQCGLSAPYQALHEQLGFAPERVAAQARSCLAQESRRG